MLLVYDPVWVSPPCIERRRRKKMGGEGEKITEGQRGRRGRKVEKAVELEDDAGLVASRSRPGFFVFLDSSTASEKDQRLPTANRRAGSLSQPQGTIADGRNSQISPWRKGPS